MAVPPYPPVPSPSTYVNGPLLVSQLRSDVTDGVNFLANPPAFQGVCTGTPSIPVNTFTPVVLDTEVFDTWSGHSPLGSAPQNYYCQAAGWYLAEGFVPWNYTGGSAVSLGAAIGTHTSTGLAISQGQTSSNTSGIRQGQYAADLVQLSRAGSVGASNVDYVQLLAFTNGGGQNLQGVSPTLPTLSARWVGTGAASSLAVPANAAFPVPPSYLHSSWLTTNITNTLGYLSNPPMLRRTYVPGTQNLATQTWPAGGTISLNTASLDNYSAWSGSAWTAPQAGVHFVYGQVALANFSGECAAGISVNGTITWGNSFTTGATTSGTQIAAYATRVRLSAGDQINLVGFQDSGSSLSVKTQTRLVIFWESS